MSISVLAFVAYTPRTFTHGFAMQVVTPPHIVELLERDGQWIVRAVDKDGVERIRGPFSGKEWATRVLEVEKQRRLTVP